MEIKTKTIPLSGLSTSPNDLSCEDGNLAVALNVVHEDGAIKNFCHSAPKDISPTHSYMYVIYQHSIPGLVTNHVIYRDNQGEKIRYLYFNLADEDRAISGWRYFPALEGKDVKNVVGIGKTLIFYTDDDVFYYIWQGSAGEHIQYTFLGNELPEIEMSFGLKAHKYIYSAEESLYYSRDGWYFPSADEQLKIYTNKSLVNGFNVHEDLDEDEEGNAENTRAGRPQNRPHESHYRSIYSTFEEEDVASVTNGVFSLVNKFTGDWCNEKGYFSQPFFVRYAIRLFDGTYTKHSAPILMIPATGANPCIPINYAKYTDSNSNNENGIEIDCFGTASELFYWLKNTANSLALWKDIIRGVDVFVSAPIYTYKQEKVTKFTMPSWCANHFGVSTGGRDGVRYFYNNPLPLEYIENQEYCHEEKRHNLWSIIAPYDYSDVQVDAFSLAGDSKYLQLTLGSRSYTIAEARDNHFSTFVDTSSLKESDVSKIGAYYPVAYIHLPKKSTAEIDKEIKDCSNFYLLKTYDINELKYDNQKTKVDIPSGYLGAIISNPILDLDYDSHSTILPNVVSVYNNRLNMAAIKKIAFKGFSAYSMLQRMDGDEDVNKPIKAIAIYLKKAGKDIVVVNASETEYDLIECPYIFYPDVDAYRVEVYYGEPTDGQYNCLAYSMQNHTGLNGAISYIGINRIKINGSDIRHPARGPIPESTLNAFSLLVNEIYTSEPGNPFKFKAANVEQVSGGRIIAMVPQSIALSEGQFGQFPMICFTTEGIWALETNDTGGWKTKQPFSRDVLLSPNAVLQLDRDIMFATTRGLMVISGSKVECISEVFDGERDIFTTAYGSALTHLRNVLYNHVGISIRLSTAPTFKNYIGGKNASMHYDYVHQRIICSNEDYPFSFVFNLKDKLWTCVMLCLKSSVNSYPNAYANLARQSDYALVDLTQDGEYEDIGMSEKGFILTRPLKLGEPNTPKTITSVIVNGNFHWSHVSTILYASNDLSKWVIIAYKESCRLRGLLGTPYRYFRVGIITSLESNESLTSLTVRYESRENLNVY